MQSPPEIILGVDVAQSADYTAVCLVERHQAPGGKATYAVTHLERFRRLSYPKQVQHVMRLVERIERAQAAWAEAHWAEPKPTAPRVILDATGVGAAVTDLFRDARLKNLTAVTITSGAATTRTPTGWHTPKKELVAVTSVLLQSQRLTIAAELDLAAVLVAELQSFRAKITAAGNEVYGNATDWRSEEHDDLVLAVSLACWAGERLPRPTMRVYASTSVP